VILHQRRLLLPCQPCYVSGAQWPRRSLSQLSNRPSCSSSNELPPSRHVLADEDRSRRKHPAHELTRGGCRRDLRLVADPQLEDVTDRYPQRVLGTARQVSSPGS
jgi:hypothetical protein